MSKIEEMSNKIQNMNLSDEEKQTLLEELLKLKSETVNIMITGATGSGKSSTINALFGDEVAKVGTTPYPETMKVTKYELDNLVIWDTPGLGDGKDKDEIHKNIITQKLREKDAEGNYLIDIVLVVLDGCSRDLGTSRELISQVIIPNLGDNESNRVLVAINQCDMAMKGRYWDEEQNLPEPKLVEFLEDKVKSVHDRIKEDTGVDIEPIYYSAGFKEEGMPQIKPYNLSKLFWFIIKNAPEKKRINIAINRNEDIQVFSIDDKKEDYNTNVKKSTWDYVKEYAPKVWKVVKEYGPIILSSLPGTGKLGKVVKFGKKVFSMFGK